MSIDDFYFDCEYLAERSRKNGIPLDYDSPATIDIELFARVVDDIENRDRVKLPKFDFKSGSRRGFEEISITDGDVFLFEGIQVLYPRVISVIEQEQGKVMGVRSTSAIDVCGTVFEPDLIRLCRRLVRDSNLRGSTPEITLPMWAGVRDNEEKNIFPHFHRCNVMIDTTMPYEMNVLSPYLKKLLAGIERTSPYYEQSKYILDLISNIEGISSDVIGKNSLYKEFV
jgi:uridine kinase